MAAAVLLAAGTATAELFSTYTNGGWRQQVESLYIVWQSGSYPQSSDVVDIQHSVSLSANESVYELLLNGGGLSGDNGLAVGHYFNWTSGNLSQGSLTLNGSSAFGFAGGVSCSRTIHNNNNIAHNGAGSLDLTATLNNSTGATYNFNSDADIANSGGAGTINNYGAIVKASGTGTSDVSSIFNNPGGVVEAQSGTLRFLGGGTVNTAVLTAAAGATLELAGGSAKYQGILSGNGAGRVIISTGTIGQTFYPATLAFSNAPLHWRGGLVDSSAYNQDKMLLDGTGTCTINYMSTLSNQGQLVQTNTGLLYLDRSFFNNAAGALHEILVDGSNVSTYIVYPGGRYSNYGTLRKAGGNATSLVQVAFDNLGGTVDVQRGTLVLQNWTGKSSNGVFTVAQDAVLDINGANSTAFAGEYTGGGPGPVVWNGGTIAFNPYAIMRLTNGGFHWRSGALDNTLINQGRLLLDGETCSINYGQTLVNEGHLFSTNASRLYIDRSYFFNQPGAVHDLLSDGSNVAAYVADFKGLYYNYGLLRKSGGTGTSLVQSAFFNRGGTVDVQRGTLILQNWSGQSSNGVFEVAQDAVLDINGANSTAFAGEYTGGGPGPVVWNGGTIAFNPYAIMRLTNGGFHWRSGALDNALMNQGRMFLDGETCNINYGQTLLNEGHLFSTNASRLYIDRSYFFNQPGAVHDLLSDGSNVAAYVADFKGLYYNYGLLRKSGGTGTSLVQSAFFNRGGTVDVQRGTLILQNWSGQSSNGVFEVAQDAVLDINGANSTAFAGEYTGGGPGPVVWNGGTITFNPYAGFNFTNGGFHWLGGQENVTMVNRGLMRLSSANEKGVGGTFINHGTLRQTNNGALLVNGSGPSAHNSAGALYEIHSGGTNLNCNGPFYNYGTLRKIHADDLSIVRSAYYNYGATVDVQRGTMSFQIWSCANSNGTFHAAQNAAIEFSVNNVPFAGDYSGNGSGTVSWVGGTITFTPYATLAFTNGGFYWRGGQLNGTLYNDGLLVLDGEETRTHNGYFQNRGQIIQSGSGRLALNGGRTVDQMEGALYEIQSDATNLAGMSAGPFNLHGGTLRKTAGSGVSVLQPQVNNYGGTIEALSGTMAFSYFAQTAGIIRLNGGHFSFPSFTLQAGTLEGTGTVSVGTLTSAGILSPGLDSPGILSINGNYSQSAGGTLNMEIGGTTPGSGHDQLAVSGSAALGGVLNVSLTNGFVPVIGQSFQLVSSTSRSGAFAVTNLPSLSTNLYWRVQYTNTGARLDVVGAIHLSDTHYAVAESGGSILIHAYRDGTPTGDASVNYATYDQTARAGFEYTLSTGVLVFADGASNASFSVPIMDNGYYQEDTLFEVRLSQPGHPYQLVAPTNATVAILNDEVLAPISTLPFLETFTSGAFSNYWSLYMAGAGRVQLTTNWTPFSPSWHLAMDSAAVSTYGLNEAILHADLSGQSNVWLRFWHKKFSDADHVMPNSFTNHSNADGVAISTDGTNWYKAQGLTTVDGISTNYKQFQICLDPILAANGLAYSHHLQIKFQQYDNNSIPSRGFVFDNIMLFVPVGSVQFASATWTVARNAGLAAIGLTRAGTSSGTAALDYATSNGTARAGFEYAASAGTASFSDGSTNASFTVAISNLSYLSDNSTIQLSLLNLPDGYVLGAPSNATVVITNSIPWIPANFPFTEGFESGTLTNCWSLYSTGAGVVRPSSSYSPHSGAWHLLMDSASNGVLSLNEAVLALNLYGQSNVWLSGYQKEFADSDHTMPATFTGHANVDGVALSVNGTNWYRLVGLTGVYSRAYYQQALVDLNAFASAWGLTLGSNVFIKLQQYGNQSITNGGFAFDDIAIFKPNGAIQFASAGSSVAKTNAQVSLSITRTTNTGTGAVSFYTQDGTAGRNEYVPTTGSVSFTEGQTNQAISIPILFNGLIDQGKTFYVVLFNYTNAAPGSPNFCTVTILDTLSETVLSTGFDTGLPPGWAVLTNAHTNAFWRFNDPKPRGNLTGGTGLFAIADSDVLGSGVAMDTELRTPVLNLTNLLTVYVRFKTDYYDGYGSAAAVAISTNGADGPWTNLYYRNGTSARGPRTETLNATALASMRSNVMFRFHYTGTYAWWWQVDDVTVYGEVSNDGDQLPDWWEVRNFTNLAAANNFTDFDHDGILDADELTADTDPRTSNMPFVVENFMRTNILRMAFTSSARRVYSAELTTNLASGSWSLLGSAIYGNDGLTNFSDNATATQRYYRIGVSRP